MSIKVMRSRTKEIETSTHYECCFNDGEYIDSFETEEEAMEYRSQENFNYISRSIHVYKVTVHMFDDGYGYADQEKIV